MGIQAIRSSRAVLVLSWVLALFGLYLTNLYSYLLFHNLAELFSVIVAFGIFIIVWNARRIVRNSYFLFLGISYLFIAVVDLIHTLAYPGMNVIQGSDTNLAAQLWIAARYLQSVSLLIAPLLLGGRLRGIWVAVGYALGVGLLLGAILYWGIFPVCFVEGEGLTPFKVISEYVISLVFLASLAFLYRKRREFDATVLQLLMASTIAAIASELAFTQYAHAYAPASLIGHLLRIVSFYLVYKAVVVTGLVRPYDLLFKNLKQEQDALREGEERYRDLVENLDDVIYSVDAQGAVTYVSPAIESWLGYTPSEIVGRDFSALVHPDDVPLARDGLRRVLSGETDPVNEYRILTELGGLRSARTSARPVVADGRIVGVRGVLTDITDQTRAEEVLRQYADESAARVRKLNCLYGISALVEKPGITLEQILQGVVELIPTAWSYPQITCARLSMEGEGFQTDNYRGTAWQQTAEIAIRGEQAGAVRVCYLQERPELDEGPFSREERRLIKAIAERVGRTIERWRAEKALRQSEARLELAIEGSNGEVWDIELDPDDPSPSLPDHVFLSPRLKGFIGYGDEEFSNSMAAWESRIPTEDIARLRESSLRYREGGIDRHDLEYRIRHKDGTFRWLRTCGRAERDEAGRPVRFAGIDWDITERKRAEERLNEAKEAAETAQRVAEERRQEAERRREIAESLAADVMDLLNSNETLDEVLDYITMQAGRLLGNQAVAIYKLEQDGKLLVRATQGLLLTYVVGREMPIGQQAFEQVMASGKAVPIPHLRTHLTSEGRPVRDAESEAFAKTWPDLYQALLAVPITVRDQPYGVIALYYVEPREFPEEEVELATVFGHQVALAIENARVRDQVQEAAAIAERERLAGDLHDAVTQTLFSAALIAETLPRIWERNPERGIEGLEELRELTQGALAEMRTLLLELRPAALTEKPLGDLLSHLATAVTSRSRVPVKLTVDGDSSLPPETQIGLYRIAQEALNNMIKHAKASEAFVDLHCEPGRATLSIRDDGRGFDPADVMPAHLGLGIMRERAERIGATLEINSDLGQGTQIKVDWAETARRNSHE
ncbi:MAG TPA: MASE3 domain-containing protein [Anaerolineae bacterium]|nr:MASE3 domain-containing protein [Anaerolineae bacterium]